MTAFEHWHQKVSKATRIYREFGIAALLQHTTSRIGSQLCEFEAFTLQCLPIERVSHPDALSSDTQMRFLTADEVEMFAADPTHELSSSHIEKGRGESDVCFAALVNGRLASYGWYSLGHELAIGDYGLVMHSPANFAHTHSGFTHPDFRGRRLHGIAKIHALRALSARGVDSLLSDIHWGNHASLRSCARVGYQTLGNLYTVGRGQRRFIHVPAAARSLGLACEYGEVGESIPLRAAAPRTVTKPMREPSEITPPQAKAPAKPPTRANGSVRKISRTSRIDLLEKLS